jgi:hypothetical protein
MHNIADFVEPRPVSNAINSGVVSQFAEMSLNIIEIKQVVAIAIARYEIYVGNRKERMSTFQHRAVFSIQQ